MITAVGRKNGVARMIHLGSDDEWHVDEIGTSQILNEVTTNRPRYSGGIGQVGFAIGDVLLRTTDGGGHWTKISIPPRTYLQSIDFSLSGIGMIVADDMILRSTDAGFTWSSIPINSLAKGIASINDSTWVVAGGNFLRSTDAGLTWNPVQTNVVLNHVAASPDGHVIAINANVIYTSSDGGLTWTDRTPGAPGDGHEYTALFYSNGVAYVAVHNFNQTRPILKSMDNGETWTSVGNRITDGYVYGLFFFDGIVGHAVGD